MLLVPPALTPDIGNKRELVGAILSSCGPSLLSRSLLGQVGIFKNRPSPWNAAYSALKSRFLLLQHRINRLEAYNEILKQQQVTTHAEISLLGDELQTARVKLYEEAEQRRKDVARMKEADNRIEDLLEKLQRYGDFIRILSGIRLDNPLYRAALSVMSNIDAEDALVTAITESAKDKTSPWARIIPAVVGPRSPENYVSALNLTLRTRKDLRERERVCEFWKAMAKMDPENADVVTPSSSDISDFHDNWDAELACKHVSTPQANCKQSPSAVDDMLECLKNDVSFKRASLTSPADSQPTFRAMAEWVTHEAKEEKAVIFNSVLSCMTGDAHDESPIRHSSALSDAVGILKNINGPNCEMKLTPRRVVRFENCQDALNETSTQPDNTSSVLSTLTKKNDAGNCDGVSRPSALNALDELIASAENFDTMDADSNDAPFFENGPDTEDASKFTSEPTSLISDTLIPTSAFDDNTFTEDNSPENDYPMEEIFIVRAGEDIPQLSIRLALDHPRGHMSSSISDSGIQSSGSEYSEMSALNQEDSEQSGSVSSCNNSLKSSVEQKQIASQPKTKIFDVIVKAAVQTSPMKLEGANIKQEPLKAFQAVKLGQPCASPTRTDMVIDLSSEKKRSSFSQAKSSSSSSPPSPPKISGRLVIADTPTKLQSNTARMRLSRDNSPASAVVSPRSTPRKCSLNVAPSKSPPGTASITRKQLLTTSRPVVSPSPVCSPAPRNNLLSPAVKYTRPPAAPSPKSTYRRASLSESTKYLKPTLPLLPNRSRLTPPRAEAIKRPIFQTTNTNLPSVREKDKSVNSTPSDHLDASKITKPSARDLGKRRGVIMMERLNIGPATPPAQKLVENTVIVPITGQIELHNLPVFCPSVSADDTASNDNPNETDASLGLDTTPKCTTAARRAKDESITARRLSRSEKLNNCDLSEFDTQVSELVDSMSGSDLGSLEVTEDSDSDSEECSSLQRVHREREGEFSGSLNALPAFCRALMKDKPGAFGKDDENDTKDRNDNPAENDLQSTPVSSCSHVKSKRFATASLISATFGHRRSATSSSSSSSSSDLSFSLDSPTRSSSATNRPLFGTTKHSPRSTNTPYREDTNKKVVQTESPTSTRSSMPSSGHAKQTSVFTKSSIPGPRTDTSVPSKMFGISSITQKATEGKDSQSNSPNFKQLKPTSPTPNEKGSRLATRPKPTTNLEQYSSNSPTSSLPDSRLWINQNIFNRLSSSKSKPTAAIPGPANTTYLTPSRNSPSQLKPRSNTINNPSSSPRSLTSGSLVSPSPSTKPRSNTVNTYSPINRSPLSQHVLNNSLEFQSRSNNSNPSPPAPTQLSMQRASIQKMAASKIAHSIGKSISPLRITKKSATAFPAPLSSRQAGPSPPTAAFMVPNKPMPSSGRRTGSSVAPLIPNCPTSSNGIISPSQCRSLLRNSLSMVR